MESVIIIISMLYAAYIASVLVSRHLDKGTYISYSRIDDAPFKDKKYFIKCLKIPFYWWVKGIINLFKD